MKYIKIKERKGDIKIRFAIFAVELVLCIAFNQKRKVIPISKKPTYEAASIPFISGITKG